MIIPRVIPCLLLLDGGLVKTVRFDQPAYVGDPVNAVRIYNDKEVDELVFLDIRATVEQRRPPFDTLAEIASECFMPVGYGGGLREVADARTVLKLGIEKVIVNTHAIEEPAFVSRLADAVGSQSVVVSLDVRNGRNGRREVFTHGGTRATGLDPVECAAIMQESGAGELLLTAIDRDGTQQGYDLDLICTVTNAVSIPVIASGGAGKPEDFGRAVREGGASACAAGSMVVYYGRHRAVLINFPSRAVLENVFS